MPGTAAASASQSGTFVNPRLATLKLKRRENRLPFGFPLLFLEPI